MSSTLMCEKVRPCHAVFVIELMEPFVSPWLFLELLHASQLVGREKLWITNVRRRCERRILKRIAGFSSAKSISELENIIPRDVKIIVLDPLAEIPLSPEDFRGRTVVVIGGIMGSHPPYGRTRRELTSRIKKALTRNIGHYQLTINGAVYVARKVCEDFLLSELELIKGLTLPTRYGVIELPYAYPQDEEGNLIIASGEIDYILTELEEDEIAMLRGKRIDICSKMSLYLLHRDQVSRAGTPTSSKNH